MNALLPGVYLAKRSDSTIYFRASVTYRNKHISLGSFDTEESAHLAYQEAGELLSSPGLNIDSYISMNAHIPFEKWVILCNFRDNKVYIPTPIYVRPSFFYYYFAPDDFYIFSRVDLFYYSAHKIQRRGGHLFVADYGSQVSILSRYGIKGHAVAGKDYIFLNGNSQDLQYSNVKVINPYHGVSATEKGYRAQIHVNGYLQIGTYPSAIEAAIAYNKAADILKNAGVDRQYATNYVDGLSAKSYADIYSSILISPAIIEWNNL